MDITKLLATLCLAGGLSLSAGCSGSLGPVNNVENATIYQDDGPMDMQRVRDAIATGLDEKGWRILDESQGWILAEVKVSDHWAKVRITYDTKNYTILHFESSPGLGYNGAQIHDRYNKWIEYLDEEIQEALEEDEDDDDDDEGDDDVEASDELAADDGDTAPDAVPGEGPTPDPDPSWSDEVSEAPPPT